MWEERGGKKGMSKRAKRHYNRGCVYTQHKHAKMVSLQEVEGHPALGNTAWWELLASFSQINNCCY